MSINQSDSESTPARADLRARLIRAARALLETQGREELTLRGVARAVGVSHMAPYRRFKDKDDLLAAVAEEGFKELAQRLDTASEGETTGVAYVAFALDNPALYRLMFGAQFTPAGRFPALDAASAQAFAFCADIAGGDANELAQENASPYAAWALWASVHGLASLIIDGRIPLSTDPARRDAEISEILGRTIDPYPARNAKS